MRCKPGEGPATHVWGIVGQYVGLAGHLTFQVYLSDPFNIRDITANECIVYTPRLSYGSADVHAANTQDL